MHKVLFLFLQWNLVEEY